MPPTEEMINTAMDKLSQLKLDYFQAEPTQVYPYDEVQLSWRVTGPNVKITVSTSPYSASRHLDVGMEGTKVVTPALTQTYHIHAQMFTVHRHLGSTTVQVSAENCYGHSVAEDEIRRRTTQVVNHVVGERDDITIKKQPQLEIDATGIKIKLRFEVKVNNFFNPDLNVDANMAVSAEHGRPIPVYTKFSSDVEFGWHEHFLTAGAAAVIQAILENKIDKELKPQLLQGIQEELDQAVSSIPPRYRLYSLSTAVNRIVFTICPSGSIG
ncbi:hypothetical protein [Melghirimyces algeriensis]|uniref:Uncharacterized protein n=1 Tax=Melghirimyces algeriensis TaxID=910412 RepID=A0A521FIW0_9BACL|nr:hypothetical protein [Melghirimyces algeriensis]SMO95954.1 hypothetical protein SAMN06264849_1219 [Melghirimyces algeriensis]